MHMVVAPTRDKVIFSFGPTWVDYENNTMPVSMRSFTTELDKYNSYLSSNEWTRIRMLQDNEGV
jgi:hypothetical protein